MRRLQLARLLACVLVTLAAGGARAEGASGEHQLMIYGRGGGQVYLSSARTQGGLGGGVGLRDTIRERFILQADLSYLLMLGNVGLLRLGAGVQRPGTYAPAVLLTFSTMVGDRLAFLSSEHPTPLQGPTMTLGVSIAPLRFTHEGLQLSLLDLGVGVGSDLPGWGVSYQLGILEVGTTF